MRSEPDGCPVRASSGGVGHRPLPGALTAAAGPSRHQISGAQILGPGWKESAMTRFHTSRIFWMAGLAVAAALPAAAAVAAPAAAATTYTITDLGSLGGGVTHGLAINASGQVTGDSVSSQLVQVPCPPRYGVPQKCFRHPDHAFVWSNGTMTDLGTLGGLDSQGVAINGSGEVVGYSAGRNTVTGAEFLWNGRNMKPLGAPAEA